VSCAWCGAPMTPNTIGHPRRYCSVECRRERGRYVERLPRWQARLAELEASAAQYKTVPVFIRNEIDWLHAAIRTPTR